MTLYHGSKYLDLPLVGALAVPGDKSLSHRMVLFAAMANGTSRITGLPDSLDIQSTLAAVAALGATVDVTPDKEGSLTGSITGWGDAGPQTPAQALECGNSGTTARLLLGMLSGYAIQAQLTGDGSLSRRPMDRVVKPLTQMGARFTHEGAHAHLPLIVCGSDQLNAIDYRSPIASAQVKSAILLAGLNAQGTTSVTEPSLSRNHTELLLPAFGVRVKVAQNKLTTCIAGGQRVASYNGTVPGDPSSAAFLLVAAALTPASEITVQGISLNPTRTGFFSVMRRMGVKIVISNSNIEGKGTEPVGDVTVCYTPELSGTIVNTAEIPSLIDEIPILALLATCSRGITRFCEVGELRHKETDRLAGIIEGLTALGFNLHADGNDLVIEGEIHPKGSKATKAAVFQTYHDHRLAMTWVVAARAFGLDVEIEGLESYKVSYPSFLDDIKRLGFT